MKSATDLTSLKAELKLILSKDLYDNIFNRDNLSYSEIQFTLESLRNIRLNLSGIHYSFKEVKSNILSAITLLKLGGKI